jgi:hypothetical protein
MNFPSGKSKSELIHCRRFENSKKVQYISQYPKETRDNNVIPIFLFTHLLSADICGKMKEIGFQIWETIPQELFEIQIWKRSAGGRINSVVGVVHLR